MNRHIQTPVVPYDADQIRNARLAKRLGQGEVADHCGVSVQAVSQWERGESSPSLENLMKLNALFGDGCAVITSFRIPELRDEIETAYDLLTALDKTGDGIGGDLGHGVSAVALAARSALDNARDMLRAMEGGR